MKTAQAIGIPAEAADTIDDALTKIGKLSLAPAPRLLIGGSLYLAGEILKENGTLPECGLEAIDVLSCPANGREGFVMGRCRIVRPRG